METTNTIHDEGISCWRLQIDVQLQNLDFINTMTFSGYNPQALNFNLFDNPSEKSNQQTIVFYFKGTWPQLEKLKEDLFEAGAVRVIANKLNQY